MSISHLSLVNQKLAYAGSLIINLHTSTAGLKAAEGLYRQALGDAVAFHLSMALHFYLREVAENHRLKNISSISSVHDLAASLEEAHKVSLESSELLELQQTKGTWLNQLTCYCDQLSRSPEKPKEKKSFGQENLIEVVELTNMELQFRFQLTPELLISWLDNFRALVVRQRETSAEY